MGSGVAASWHGQPNTTELHSDIVSGLFPHCLLAIRGQLHPIPSYTICGQLCSACLCYRPSCMLSDALTQTEVRSGLTPSHVFSVCRIRFVFMSVGGLGGYPCTSSFNPENHAHKQFHHWLSNFFKGTAVFAFDALQPCRKQAVPSHLLL